MQTRTLAFLGFLALACGLAGTSSAQEGLRLPAKGLDPAIGGSGIDPSLAAGWLNPRQERFTAPGNWRDTYGFAPLHGIEWSYPLGDHSLGMTYESGRDYVAAPIFGVESRQYGLFGRYAFDPDWSLSAGAYSRQTGTAFRLEDFRIGLRRRF